MWMNGKQQHRLLALLTGGFGAAEHEITVTWDPAAAAVQARATETAKTATVNKLTGWKARIGRRSREGTPIARALAEACAQGDVLACPETGGYGVFMCPRT